MNIKCGNIVKLKSINVNIYKKDNMNANKSIKHEMGQYFTTNTDLKNKVFEFIINDPSKILEPSIGQGDLVQFISKMKPQITFDMYEIDKDILLLDNISRENVTYGDFMNANIKVKYETIIGNPPYVRTRKGNLYIDFTEKCYNLLNENGELIFIVPSDFLKLTSASTLLNKMMQHGTFTHIYHPHDEKMFENASIDIIVFRYCKNDRIRKEVMYNNKKLYITNSNGMITFNERMNESNKSFKDLFDIYVGIVSAKESVYKNIELGNITVLNGEDNSEKYICIDEFPCKNNAVNQYLLKHKDDLLSRKIRKFNENNWYEWGALRNINAVKANHGKDCIYLYNLTRKKKVSFLGKVGYFGGSLIMLLPKKKCNLTNIAAYINSEIFMHNFMFSGRFKIGHRQISNSLIPNELL